jgi:hypothetical protein
MWENGQPHKNWRNHLVLMDEFTGSLAIELPFLGMPRPNLPIHVLFRLMFEQWSCPFCGPIKIAGSFTRCYEGYQYMVQSH